MTDDTQALGKVDVLSLVDWAKVVLPVTNVTPVLGRIATYVALSTIAVRIPVICREGMSPGLNTGTPVIGRRVTLGTVITPKVMRPLVTIATDKPESSELGPVVTVETLRGGVVVHQRYWVFCIPNLLPHLHR
jgi:hypothetical protein